MISYTDRLGNTQNAAYKSLSTEYSFTPAGSTVKENHYTENYDMYGNKISEKIYPSGTGGSALTTAYEYDLVGNVLKITDANGRVTAMSYDEVNNPTEVILADGNKVSYDYTKWNSVKNTTQYDGEQPYSIAETFDDRGLSTSHRQIGLEINTKPWYYSYRADGLISLSVAPDGTQRSYDYDGSGNNTYYTVGAVSDAMTYNHFGQLDKITRTVSGTQTGVTDYTYDSAKGWLTSKTTGLGTTAYAYNTAGKLTSVTSPSGLIRTYARDAADRITTGTKGDVH